MIDSIQVRHLDQIHRVLIADEFNLIKQKIFWIAWQAHQAPRCAVTDLVIADIERRIAYVMS